MRPTNGPHVVAHVQFVGMSEEDMTIQTLPGDRYYLYVQHSKGEDVSVIGISKPEKPKPSEYFTRGMQLAIRMRITGTLAIVANHAADSSHGGEFSNGDVVIWDTSNPTSPRLVQKFSKVVKWLQDNREFIYLLADDGLWIVSQPDDRLPNSPDSSAYGGG